LKAHALSTLRQELILAQQEAIEQKDLREQDLAQLRRACEESLEGQDDITSHGNPTAKLLM